MLCVVTGASAREGSQRLFMTYIYIYPSLVDDMNSDHSLSFVSVDPSPFRAAFLRSAIQVRTWAMQREKK